MCRPIMRNSVGILLLAALLASACDEKPSAPAVLSEQARHAAEGPKRPTTQELLTGPRKRIVLGPMPFSVRAPASWKIEVLPANGISMLQGPTPSGEAQIQLSTRPTTSSQDLDRLVQGAKKELAEHPDRVRKAELRSIGAVKIFERQALGTPGPLTVMDSTGEEHVETATPYNWTVWMFVPAAGGSFEKYEMNFIGLTEKEHDIDKPLLDEIVSTINYELAAPATRP
jgi:hypothetical protein